MKIRKNYKKKSRNRQIFKNNNKFKWIFLLFLGILLFTYGFLSSKYKIFPYQQTKKNILDECNLPTINNIPSNSTIFIGHAYGSPEKSDVNDFIAKKIFYFLKLNLKNIDKVIFTGDVFSVPSISKWTKLENTFGPNFEIHIAPGNHDILRPDSKDVFLQSKYGLKKYPYSIELMKNVLIIDDSVSSEWKVSSETVKKILKNKNKLSIVARHNIPIKELKDYVNSWAGVKTNFTSYNDLQKIIPKKNRVIWIIGDSGALKSLPRIKCFKKDNHTFILNGIGEVLNDTITLLNQNKLYSYVLK
ncbi:metallophosphoesterase [Pelagibacteraceae bacterium]|mgnify:FL=1|jgi:hypothetical protein|nr:metallophosphoesterase [Pelagibacteraceae bacterium]|tara:strand:- start:4635 stop:5540 length:906 start_codon:yes stop_codon:yes gene_type:complete